MVWPAIIGAIGSIAGGALSAISSGRSNQTQLDVANQNAELQREFAQQGVRWKAADARAAGLHPLFAMGASTHSFNPVSVTPTPTDYSWVGRTGQDIGRAVQAGLEKKDRNDILLERTARVLQLNRMGLENEVLQSQLARMRGQLGPTMPTMGQSSPGGVSTADVTVHPTLGTFEMKPSEITTTLPSDPATVAGPAGGQSRWELGPNGALQSFPPKHLGTEDELGAPLSARWWATQSYFRPPPDVWKKVWPSAIGVTWSSPRLGWVPVYPKEFSRGHLRRDQYQQYQTPWERARARAGVVTVPMPRR